MSKLAYFFSILICLYNCQTLPPIGPTLQNYGVIGASTVTNTGTSLIYGNVGVSPGTSITGFPPGIAVFPGVVVSDASMNAAAHSDALILNATLLAETPTHDISGFDLGSITLVPGVYTFSSSAICTVGGVLVLDGLGNSSSVWIFQIGSTLITHSACSVQMINQGNPCNVFWDVGTSATIGGGNGWIGTIVAWASITMNIGSAINGTLAALVGAVTLDTNSVFPCLPNPCQCICGTDTVSM